MVIENEKNLLPPDFRIISGEVVTRKSGRIPTYIFVGDELVEGELECTGDKVAKFEPKRSTGPKKEFSAK